MNTSIAAEFRPADHLFTTIRDPIEQMISQANYAIGRLRQDPIGRDPDTAELLQHLGIPRHPTALANRDLKDLAVRALLDPRISRPNQACLHLGKRTTEAATEYDVAMNNLVLYDIEVTTTQHYGRWLHERWVIAHSERHNQSDTILTRREVLRYCADALKEAIAEDQKLFDVVLWALRQTGTPSITGSEIARLAGASLLDSFPDFLHRHGPPTEASGKRQDDVPNLLVTQEPEQVARHPAATIDPAAKRAEIQVLLQHLVVTPLLSLIDAAA